MSGSDVYLCCKDQQKRFIGKIDESVKTGDILCKKSTGEKYIIKAFSCGVAVIKRISR